MFQDDIVREFGETTQKGHCAVQGHSRSPIVIQIDFLLVINTNLLPILHRFRDIAFDSSKIAIFGYPCCVECRRWSSSLHHIMVSDTSLKTRNYGLYFCRRKFTYIFNHFYAVRREFAEIAQTNDHYAVQGHSRSPILVPIESSSRTSYK